MATRADVARLAGVSEAAVSYAISGKRPLTEETRQRVFAAMDALDYQPHAMARALAGGKSMILALLFPTHERGMSNADLEYVLGAAAAARELGYHLLLWPTDGFDAIDALALQKAGMIDGMLLMEVRLDDDRVAILDKAGVPYALIGRTAEPGEGIAYADRDFAAVTEHAVSYLHDLGHRRIAYLGGSDSTVRLRDGAVVRSEEGYRAACRARGLTPRVFAVEPTVDAGRRFYEEQTAGVLEFTALVAMNADAATGVMAAAHEDGQRVPRELSVLSIATPATIVSLTTPPLTTISPPAEQIGAAAARSLIARLATGEPGDEPRLWAGELVVRGSTAPPPRP